MKKYIGNIIPWLIIVSSVGLIIYNVMYNEKFLETSLVSILSLVTVILVSFYLVQMKNEKSKKNEKINYLLTKIQNIILSEDFIKYGTKENAQKTLISLRTVGNKIVILGKYKEDSRIKRNSKINELYKSLEESFDNLKEFFGNHMYDEQYLDKSKKEFMNYIFIIDDVCDQLHMLLI